MSDNDPLLSFDDLLSSITASFDRYVLKGKTPVPCSDFLDWAISYEQCDRRIAQTSFMGGKVRISTVFLGLPHIIWSDPDSLPMGLFETMIFGGEHNELQRRFRTWEDAEFYHWLIVKILRDRYRSHSPKLHPRYQFKLARKPRSFKQPYSNLIPSAPIRVRAEEAFK